MQARRASLTSACTAIVGDELNQPLVVAAAANEVYKRAKAAGHGDADFAAVYEAINPRK